MKRGLIFLLVLFNFTFISSYDCWNTSYWNVHLAPICENIPSDGCILNKSITFENGEYSLSHGICSRGKSIILDCNYSILKGDGNFNGINLFGTENITIKNCIILNYSKGIFISYSGRCNSNQDVIKPSKLNNLENNFLENNSIGIESIGASCSPTESPGYIFYNTKIKIISNFLKKNSIALKSERTDFMNITENTFQENINLSLSLEELTSKNIAYQNNFLEEVFNAVDLTQNNSWNLSKQGNYWKMYDSGKEGCVDDNLDILCDEPFYKDFFPYKIQEGWKKNFCSGSIQIFVKDSMGKEIEGINIFFDDTFKNKTNNVGISNLLVIDSCGKMQKIHTNCFDGTLCQEKNVSIDFYGEKEYLEFDCSKCLEKKDIFISNSDIEFDFSEDISKVMIKVHSLNLNVENLEVIIHSIGFDGLIKEEVQISANLEKNSEKILSVPINLEEMNYIAVYIDPNEKISEDKENNFVRKSVNKKIKAYLDLGTGLSEIDAVIEKFLETFIAPSSLEDSEIRISVGKFSEGVKKDILNNKEFIESNFWGYNNEKIFVDGKYLLLPYEGLIGSYQNIDGKKSLVFLGTEIEGTIAALKKLNSMSDVYLTKEKKREVLILNKVDLDALGVYDLLHNEENSKNYLKNNDYFKLAVEKILEENSYDISINTLKTTNNPPVTLRIKNLRSEFSNKYKSIANINSAPVVFSGGLWSNLFRWEEFGKELASSGKDVWLIEITGGPLIERDSDPNYEYSDLVDSYWPASLAAIQYYSNYSLLQYVGFSNGCRVALSALEKYQEEGKENVAEVQDLITGKNTLINLKGGPILDTFIGIGCPGDFEGNSFLIEKVKSNPDSPEELEKMNLSHVTMKQVALFLDTFFGRLFPEENLISQNLWEFYNKIILSGSESLPGKFNIKNTAIIYGYGGVNGIGEEQEDGLVTIFDSKNIATNINSTDIEKIFGYRSNHKFLPENRKVQEKIKENILLK